MTTARTVAVTTEMDGDELDTEDAWHLARRHGLRTVLVGSFVRFHYGDGFTNSRALALQTCLSVLPFLLAVMGSRPTSTASGPRGSSPRPSTPCLPHQATTTPSWTPWPGGRRTPARSLPLGATM